MAKSIDLGAQAQKILETAQKYGAEHNFLFITTFKRYQTQLLILQDLEKVLKEEESIITKEYVKGRKNLYENPAVRSYNSTSNNANRTAETLLKIIRELRAKKEDGGDNDPLLRVLRGEDI